jgi:hypothetical protein
MEPFRNDAKSHKTEWPGAILWLADDALISAASREFTQNRRVAQEAFGWEKLCSMAPTNFDPEN